MTLGDLDGDGDLDAVVANLFMQPESVWLNDGTGTFVAHPTTPSFGTGHSYGVALGDLDGDGDLDALVTNVAQPNTAWMNDGTGAFAAHPTTPSFGVGGFGVELGDLDGDGDLDAVVAVDNGPQTVWLNDGSGNFSAHPTTPGFDAGSTFRTALGDLDGDGDLDAVVTHSAGEAETVWVNDGTGGFTAHPTMPSFGAGDSRQAALGDLDGDGDLDAVVTSFSAGVETVWVNDGTGAFSAHPTTPSFGGGDSLEVALDDLDGDGDVDAVVANFFGQAETVWVNQGAGSFAAHPTTPSFGAGDSRAVALGDLDGDGDPDTIVADADAETVWLNSGTGTAPVVLEYACALASNGLLRAVDDPADCTSKSETAVTFSASTPVTVCAQPDGSVRQIPRRNCKKPAVVLTLPAPVPTYFCADFTTGGVLRHVTQPPDCQGSETVLVV